MARPSLEKNGELSKSASLRGKLDPVPPRNLKSAVEHGTDRLLLVAWTGQDLSNFEEVLHLPGSHELKSAGVNPGSDQIAIEVQRGDCDRVRTLADDDGPQPVAAVVLRPGRHPFPGEERILCLARLEKEFPLRLDAHEGVGSFEQLRGGACAFTPVCWQLDALDLADHVVTCGERWCAFSWGCPAAMRCICSRSAAAYRSRVNRDSNASRAFRPSRRRSDGLSIRNRIASRSLDGSPGGTVIPVTPSSMTSPWTSPWPEVADTTMGLPIAMASRIVVTPA